MSKISTTKNYKQTQKLGEKCAKDILEKGLQKEINAEFYCATTRPPSVYRGNPFIVEAGIAYGQLFAPPASREVYRAVPLPVAAGLPGACNTSQYQPAGVVTDTGMLTLIKAFAAPCAK